MHLPCILSPALCCLLTLSLQHVAGLAVPRSAPAAYPPSCQGTVPSLDTSRWTPEESTSVYSCIQSECGVASPSEECTACIGDLLVDFKHLREGSKIAKCLCQSKGQVHQGQSPQLDANQLRQFKGLVQQFFDSQDQVNELPDTEYQTNDLHYEQLREMSQEPTSSQGRVYQRQNGGLPKITARQLAELLGPLLAALEPIAGGIDQGVTAGATNVNAALRVTGEAVNQAAQGVGKVAQGATGGAGGTIAEVPGALAEAVRTAFGAPQA